MAKLLIMQKVLKSVVLCVFLIAGIAVFATRTQAILSENHNSTISYSNSARDLYQKNCARCHGADGKSDTELGRLFDSPDLTAGSIQRMSRKKMAASISNGKGGMPAFKKKLSSKEIALMVNYVRSF